MSDADVAVARGRTRPPHLPDRATAWGLAFVCGVMLVAMVMLARMVPEGEPGGRAVAAPAAQASAEQKAAPEVAGVWHVVPWSQSEQAPAVGSVRAARSDRWVEFDPRTSTLVSNDGCTEVSIPYRWEHDSVALQRGALRPSSSGCAVEHEPDALATADRLEPYGDSSLLARGPGGAPVALLVRPGQTESRAVVWGQGS